MDSRECGGAVAGTLGPSFLFFHITYLFNWHSGGLGEAWVAAVHAQDLSLKSPGTIHGTSMC